MDSNLKNEFSNSHLNIDLTTFDSHNKIEKHDSDKLKLTKTYVLKQFYNCIFLYFNNDDNSNSNNNDNQLLF